MYRLMTITLAAVLMSAVSLSRGQATQPGLAGVQGAGPEGVAVEEPKKETQISDSARTTMNLVRDGYAKLKSLQVSGTVNLNLDAGPEQEKKAGTFTATYQAPTSFRHEMTDDMLIVNNGEKAYLYKIDKKLYVPVDAPKERASLDNLPDPIAALLQQQNPTVLLALVEDAGKSLVDGVETVDRGEDVTVGGTAYQSLVLKSGGQKITALVDPKSGLLRQMKIDLKDYLMSRNVPNVNAAELTIDYTRTLADAPVELAGFAWTPPDDATLVKLPAPEAQAAAPQGEASTLVGKSAPLFALKDLKGADVALGDLKGSVVVLDFWATWCGPCVQAMPHLAELNKDLAPKGLKVYAVNLRETTALVEKFLEDQKLSIPVLMDNEGSTAELYKVTGIPQTVVIGKDGNVTNVFVGFGPGGENQLREAVEAAMK